MKSVAIIPARGGSVRLPRKNILDVCGKPMICYPIKTCLDSGCFDQVYVSSEDDEIITIAKNCGAEIIVRPDDLASDQARVREVVQHAISLIEEKNNMMPEFTCIVYPTAVLIKPFHIVESFDLLQKTPDADFVLAVTELNPHPFKALKASGGYLRPMFENEIDKKSQLFEDAYAPSGTFHWGRSEMFFKAADYWNQNRVPYVIDAYCGIDIDHQKDIELARRIMAADLHGKMSESKVS